MRTLIFIGMIALGAAGCGGDNKATGTPDMASTTGPGGCFSGTPASDEQFLNACTSADAVDITPFYPAAAPNGVLPTLP